MTVNDAIKHLTELQKKGLGDAPVIWDSISHTWPVEFREVKRNGHPAILANA